MATARPSELRRLPDTPKLGSFDLVEEASNLFLFMKAAENLATLQPRCISFAGPGGRSLQLTPVSKVHLDQHGLATELRAWRQAYPQVFPQDGVLTDAGTLKWLREQVVDNPDRLLFLVEDCSHRHLGHLGLWIRDGWRIELDNVLQDPQESGQGVFLAATQAVVRWANEFLGLERIYLRVLASNEHALRFYRQSGFLARATLPLEYDGSIDEEQIESGGDLDVSIADCDHWVIMSSDTEAWNLEEEGDVLTAGPSIGIVETSLAADAVRSGWNHHHSDYLTEFSERFAGYVGAKYAIPTDSCTSALHLALWALGIGTGDEVIVPETTWVATANAARYVGATPVFADIDPDTWCIDPRSVEGLITDKTRAVIPVHLYGYVANIDAISDLCRKYDLHLVQDAAPGIGSMWGSSGVAEFGDFSCFSFQGAKLLVSGEGGVLTTNSDELFQNAFKIGDSGRRPGTFWIDHLGKKMKMSNLTASLALAQLVSAERQIKRKRLIRDWYLEDLSDIPNLSFQSEAPDTRSICWMTSIHIDRPDFDRDWFRRELAVKGIDTRPVFSPISRYPYWEPRQAAGAVASRVGDSAINLPSGVGLARETVRRVSREIRQLMMG